MVVLIQNGKRINVSREDYNIIKPYLKDISSAPRGIRNMAAGLGIETYRMFPVTGRIVKTEPEQTPKKILNQPQPRKKPTVPVKPENISIPKNSSVQETITTNPQVVPFTPIKTESRLRAEQSYSEATPTEKGIIRAQAVSSQFFSGEAFEALADQKKMDELAIKSLQKSIEQTPTEFVGSEVVETATTGMALPFVAIATGAGASAAATKVAPFVVSKVPQAAGAASFLSAHSGAIAKTSAVAITAIESGKAVSLQQSGKSPTYIAGELSRDIVAIGGTAAGAKLALQPTKTTKVLEFGKTGKLNQQTGFSESTAYIKIQRPVGTAKYSADIRTTYTIPKTTTELTKGTGIVETYGGLKSYTDIGNLISTSKVETVTRPTLITKDLTVSVGVAKTSTGSQTTLATIESPSGFEYPITVFNKQPKVTYSGGVFGTNRKGEITQTISFVKDTSGKTAYGRSFFREYIEAPTRTFTPDTKTPTISKNVITDSTSKTQAAVITEDIARTLVSAEKSLATSSGSLSAPLGAVKYDGSSTYSEPLQTKNTSPSVIIFPEKKVNPITSQRPLLTSNDQKSSQKITQGLKNITEPVNKSRTFDVTLEKEKNKLTESITQIPVTITEPITSIATKQKTTQLQKYKTKSEERLMTPQRSLLTRSSASVLSGFSPKPKNVYGSSKTKTSGFPFSQKTKRKSILYSNVKESGKERYTGLSDITKSLALGGGRATKLIAAASSISFETKIRRGKRGKKKSKNIFLEV